MKHPVIHSLHSNTLNLHRSYRYSMDKNFFLTLLHLFSCCKEADRFYNLQKVQNINFDVLLTVHLSIILVIKQLSAQNLVL